MASDRSGHRLPPSYPATLATNTVAATMNNKPGDYLAPPPNRGCSPPKVFWTPQDQTPNGGIQGPPMGVSIIQVQCSASVNNHAVCCKINFINQKAKAHATSSSVTYYYRSLSSQCKNKQVQNAKYH